MSEPLFSIIMAAYNAEDTIEEAVSSARSQTLGDFELIVIDDGSTDRTPSILDQLAREDARLRVIHQANAGANPTRNRALAAARGEFVTFLDSDDLKLPTYLEAVREQMGADPSIGLAYSDCYVLEDRHRRIRRSTVLGAYRVTGPAPSGVEALLGRLIEGCFIPFSATTVRRSVIEAAGAFDPRIAGTDDWELWIRIIASGVGVVRVPGTLAVMRRVEGQISGNRAVMLRNNHLMFTIIADDLGVPASVRERARERAMEAEAQLAAEGETVPAPESGLRATLRQWKERVTWIRSWRLRHPRELAAAFPRLRRSHGAA